jgi:hypothetical protein
MLVTRVKVKTVVTYIYNFGLKKQQFLNLMYNGRGYKRKPKIEKIQQLSAPGRRV